MLTKYLAAEYITNGQIDFNATFSGINYKKEFDYLDNQLCAACVLQGRVPEIHMLCLILFFIYSNYY
jgi:hypothetical protein